MAITDAQNLFVGHDNVIQLTLTEDGVDYDLTAESVTKVKLDFGTFEVDSIADPGAIFWHDAILNFKLGRVTDVETLAANNVAAKARLIVYTAANPNGVVWSFGSSEFLKFKLKQPY